MNKYWQAVAITTWACALLIGLSIPGIVDRGLLWAALGVWVGACVVTVWIVRLRDA